MRRRSGQNGSIVIQPGWYRVRWRQDIEGQQERINMTAKIARSRSTKTAIPSLRHLKSGAKRERLLGSPVRTQRVGSIRSSSEM
jgi:hypothetical protein